jgi:hypothetical protein
MSHSHIVKDKFSQGKSLKFNPDIFNFRKKFNSKRSFWFNEASNSCFSDNILEDKVKVKEGVLKKSIFLSFFSGKSGTPGKGNRGD